MNINSVIISKLLTCVYQASMYRAWEWRVVNGPWWDSTYTLTAYCTLSLSSI